MFESLSISGNVSRAAQAAEIARCTHYGWLKTDAQYGEAFEQAKVQATKQAEHDRLSRLQSLTQAEQERKKAIETAVAAAQSKGCEEVESLKAQAEKDRQQLRDSTDTKIAGAAAKVLDFLKG